MQTQHEIIDIIVAALAPLKQVEKIIFSANYLVNGTPYDVTLIIYENCQPNYIVSQQTYEELLKDISNNINLNILAVNADSAQMFLNKRLESFLTIYKKKKLSET